MTSPLKAGVEKERPRGLSLIASTLYNIGFGQEPPDPFAVSFDAGLPAFRGENIDLACQKLFPLTFALFNACYWGYYIHSNHMRLKYSA